MFSPTLFWDFYTANGQTIVSCDLFRYDLLTAKRARWQYGAYKPGTLRNVSSGGLGAGSWGIVAIIEKTSDPAGITIPQQGMYDEIWETGIVPPHAGNPKKLSLDRRIRDWFLAKLPVNKQIWLRALRKTKFPLPPDRWI